MHERAVLLTDCERVGSALLHAAKQLSARFAEVVVAIDDHAACVHALPARWSAARHALRELPRVWVTPLASTPTLGSRADQLAALPARLGALTLVQLETPALWPWAELLGLPVELVPPLEGTAPGPVPHAERALVVLRAQPFHRGHLALIEHALSLCEEVVVVVASAERSHSAHDPFTAGERLAMVRAGLGALAARCWLVALAAPTWPALALPQLALVAPHYALVAAHNPVLRAMAEAHGKPLTGLPALLAHRGQALCATAIRARLAEHGAGAWLEEVLPTGTASLLRGCPSLAARCAMLR